MIESISAALLAGGRSQRMGRDKAFLPDGASRRAYWQKQLDTLRELEPQECLISANPTQIFGTREARIIFDGWPDHGPLGGIASCLQAMASRSTHLVVLAVDMPRITSDLLRGLLQAASPACGALYQLGERYEPLVAVYPRATLALALSSLREKRLKMQDFVSELIVEGLMKALGAPPESVAFQNVNAPQDLATPLP